MQSAQQAILRQPAAARREHDGCIAHMQSIAQNRLHIGRIFCQGIIERRLDRRHIDRAPLGTVRLSHEEEERTVASIRIIELANRRIHIDRHRMRERCNTPRRRPRDPLTELTKAQRRSQEIFHRIAAHHHAIQRKFPLIGAHKCRIPYRRRTERRYNQLLRRHPHIRKPRRSEDRSRSAETVPCEIEFCSGMSTQIFRNRLTGRTVPIGGQSICKQRCLAVVQETAVHQRHILALRSRLIPHLQKLTRTAPAEHRPPEAQIRPHIAPALRAREGDEMNIRPVRCRPHHMEEPPDRPAVSRRLISFDPPARRCEPRTHKLRQLARIRSLRRRRAHEKQRREIRRSRNHMQGRKKNAEKQENPPDMHHRISFSKIFSLLYPFSL